MMADDSSPPSLPERAGVVNVGLAALGDAVRAQGAEAVDVDWRIPAGGDPQLVSALARLFGRLAPGIERANREVLRRLDESSPLLLGIAPALQGVPGMDSRTVLHCGPRLPWEAFCGPLRRSVRATVMAEGWAGSPAEAESLASAAAFTLEAANDHAAVVPMAATVGPSTPVFLVENPQGGNRSFAPLNQGPGGAAWFGVDSADAVARLVWMRETLAPVLDRALRAHGPVDLVSLITQGLLMGDDLHMRSQATSNLLIRALLPQLVAIEDPQLAAVARFLSSNHHFFLNLAMASAKAATDWASQVPGSTLVTSMARNGTTFGIRVAGMGERWFVAPAPPVESALFQPGFGPQVAAPDIGDSAVLELVGLGGAAAAASPAVAGFLGGSMAGAAATTETMASICAGSSGRLKLGFLDFRGAPIGVDARLVVELEATPAINTGILHATEPVGQIGAGVARAPLDCFRQSLLALNALLR
jgi:hypothetical protein